MSTYPLTGIVFNPGKCLNAVFARKKLDGRTRLDVDYQTLHQGVDGTGCFMVPVALTVWTKIIGAYTIGQITFIWLTQYMDKLSPKLR